MSAQLSDLLYLRERQEKARADWFNALRPTHPHGLSGENQDCVSAILDQGYYFPVRPWMFMHDG